MGTRLMVALLQDVANRPKRRFWLTPTHPPPLCVSSIRFRVQGHGHGGPRNTQCSGTRLWIRTVSVSSRILFDNFIRLWRLFNMPSGGAPAL